MVNAYGQSSAKMIIDYFVQKFSVCRSFWTDKNALYGFLLVKLLSFKLLFIILIPARGAERLENSSFSTECKFFLIIIIITIIIIIYYHHNHNHYHYYLIFNFLL